MSSKFDPFGDGETAGYLRNIDQEKDRNLVKTAEHTAFALNLESALQYLTKSRDISYKSFLAVHKILFSDFYPWAGTDRSVTLTGVEKETRSGKRIPFCHPAHCELAVNEGLRLASEKGLFKKKAGTVMGCFANGHPFLDGNGRTILLVHMELCYRAGFSIAWPDTDKDEYLSALTKELETPYKGILDNYLSQFIVPRLERNSWGKQILSIKGLDGLDDNNLLISNLADPAVAEMYSQLEAKRGYYLQAGDAAICEKCHAVPCVCAGAGSVPRMKP